MLIDVEYFRYEQEQGRFKVACSGVPAKGSQNMRNAVESWFYIAQE